MKTLIAVATQSLLLLAMSAQAQDHSQHTDHGTVDHGAMDHSQHADHGPMDDHASMDHSGHHEGSHDHMGQDHADDDAPGFNSEWALITHTQEIDEALARGGEPVVADVLGVVCDFCALAMNKIFSKREEVAAVYVDLDTKALNLVLVPGAQLTDEVIADLAVQAGYRVAAIRRGAEALGTAT